MVIGYGLWYCMVLLDSRVGRSRSSMTRVTTAHKLLDSPVIRAALAMNIA